MTTVYIKGKSGYKHKVRKSLNKSKLTEGDHYIEGVNSLHNTALYWITSRITLREFKLAITADIVWRYRLQFFENVEDLVVKKNDSTFTSEELKIIEKYEK